MPCFFRYLLNIAFQSCGRPWTTEAGYEKNGDADTVLFSFKPPYKSQKRNVDKMICCCHRPNRTSVQWRSQKEHTQSTLANSSIGVVIMAASKCPPTGSLRCVGQHAMSAGALPGYLASDTQRLFSTRSAQKHANVFVFSRPLEPISTKK